MKNSNVQTTAKKMMGLNTLVNKLGKTSSSKTSNGFAAFIDTLISNLKVGKSEKTLAKNQIEKTISFTNKNPLINNKITGKENPHTLKVNGSLENKNLPIAKEEALIPGLDNPILAGQSIPSVLNLFEKISQLDLPKANHELKSGKKRAGSSETQLVKTSTFKSFIKELKNSSTRSTTETKVIEKLLKEPLPVQKAVYAILKEISKLSAQKIATSDEQLSGVPDLKKGETLIQQTKTVSNLVKNKIVDQNPVSDKNPAFSKVVSELSTNGKTETTIPVIKGKFSKVIVPQKTEISNRTSKGKVETQITGNKNSNSKPGLVQSKAAAGIFANEKIEIPGEVKQEPKYLYIGRKSNKNRISVQVNNNQAIVTANKTNKRNLTKASGYIKSLVRNNFLKPENIDSKTVSANLSPKQQPNKISTKASLSENIPKDFLKDALPSFSRKEVQKAVLSSSPKSTSKAVLDEKSSPTANFEKKVEKDFKSNPVSKVIKNETNQTSVEIVKNENKAVIKEIFDFNVNKNLKVKFVFTDETVKAIPKLRVAQQVPEKPGKAVVQNKISKNISLNDILRNNSFLEQKPKTAKINPVKLISDSANVSKEILTPSFNKKNEKQRVKAAVDKTEKETFVKPNNAEEKLVQPSVKVEKEFSVKESPKQNLQTPFLSDLINGKAEKSPAINNDMLHGNVVKKDGQNDAPVMRSNEEIIFNTAHQTSKITNAVFTKPLAQVKYISGIIQNYYDSGSQTFTQSQVVVDAGKMGNLDIRLNKESGAQTILILVENDTIKTEMARMLPHLAESLQSKGVPVNSVNIDVGQSWDKNNKRNNNKNNQKTNLSQTMEGQNDKDTTMNSKRYYGYNTMDIIA